MYEAPKVVISVLCQVILLAKSKLIFQVRLFYWQKWKLKDESKLFSSPDIGKDMNFR